MDPGRVKTKGFQSRKIRTSWSLKKRLILNLLKLTRQDKVCNGPQVIYLLLKTIKDYPKKY